jgi:hypothetical protein
MIPFAACQFSILVIPILDKYLFPIRFDGHALERRSYARPPDTLPRFGLEGRTVIGTHEVTAIDSKKLVIHPIQRKTNMGASIQVGVQRPVVIEQYAFEAIFPVGQSKLFGHTGDKLASFADQFSPGFFLGSIQTHALQCSISQVGKVSFWTAHQHFVLVDANGQPIKRLSLTWACDTNPASPLVERPVCVAHEVLTVLAQELIPDKIQRRRHMATAIDVGMKTSTLIYQKPGHPVLLANNRESSYRAGLHIRYAGDDASPGTTCLQHAPFVAPEKSPANRQAD